MELASPDLDAIYEIRSADAKIGLSVNSSEDGRMHANVRAITIAVLAIGGSITTAEAQERHVVRMETDAKRGEYRFVPAVVSARPGDVVVFRAVSGAPHSIVFEGSGLAPAARAALNQAMPRRSGDLSSPLLTEGGAEYRLTVPQLPQGRYAFFCLPHRAYDMRGELVIP